MLELQDYTNFYKAEELKGWEANWLRTDDKKTDVVSFGGTVSRSTLILCCGLTVFANLTLKDAICYIINIPRSYASFPSLLFLLYFSQQAMK